MGTFTISFDCEGRWGSSDAEGPLDDIITSESLADVYERLFHVLESNHLRATFAVVGAFTLDPDELKAHPLAKGDVSDSHTRWCEKLRKQIRTKGHVSGWTLPSLAHRVRQGGHELATHGFSHLPFDAMSEQESNAEIGMLESWIADQPEAISSLVYPRNRIGRLPQVAAAGISCYRRRVPRGSRVSLAEIATELSPIGSYETSSDATFDYGMVGLPPGRFLNRRVGPRALVPPAVTRRSWHASLTAAASQNNAILHLWLHPHNLLEDRSAFELFRDVVQHAGTLVRGGHLANLTMAETGNLVSSTNR